MFNFLKDRQELQIEFFISIILMTIPCISLNPECENIEWKNVSSQVIRRELSLLQKMKRKAKIVIVFCFLNIGMDLIGAFYAVEKIR